MKQYLRIATLITGLRRAGITMSLSVISLALAMTLGLLLTLLRLYGRSPVRTHTAEGQSAEMNTGGLTATAVHSKRRGSQMAPLHRNRGFLVYFLLSGLLGIWFSAAFAEEPAASGSDADLESRMSFRVYAVREGDTLASIAAQTRVYNNSLKWPLIYFFNREDLQEVKIPAAGLASTPLPPGMALAIMLPAEAGKRAVRRAEERPWVVNIISSTNADDLAAPVIRLIDNGRFAYISEWTFKEKRWKRLRIGFFPDRDAAVASGRMVLEELGLPNCWVVRAEWSELVEFCGYAE